MIRKIAYLATALLLVGCAHTEPALNVKADLKIQNVTVIDAVLGERKNQTVLVSGERISYVGTDADAPANAVIDGNGKYLIPGLWDAHVHLTFEPELDDAMFNLFLANGITSVRDTGGQLDKVLAWKNKAKTELGPEVFIAGPLIDGKPGVYMGKSPGFPEIGIEVDTPEKVIATVDSLAAAGVDLLKAYEMLSPESYTALLARAAFHGLPVTGHVPLSMTAVEVSKQGLNSMEHLRNLEMDCSENADELLSQRRVLLENKDNKLGSKLRTEIHNAQHYSAAASYDKQRCDELVATLASNQTWQIPTLTLMMASKIPYYAQDDWRATFQHLPEPLRTKWVDNTQKFKAALDKPSPGRDKRVVVADWKMRMVKTFADSNIPIMAGTDMPIFYLTPGFSLHKELETLAMAGLSPMQVLATATINPAKYFNKQDSMGSVEVGKLADLVLLNANPLADINNTKTIETVVRKGVTLDRPRLNQMLQSAAN